jgi:hypothetical protein
MQLLNDEVCPSALLRINLQQTMNRITVAGYIISLFCEIIFNPLICDQKKPPPKTMGETTKNTSRQAFLRDIPDISNAQ